MEAHASELLEEEASVQQEEAKALGGLHGFHGLIWLLSEGFRVLSGFAGVRTWGSHKLRSRSSGSDMGTKHLLVEGCGQRKVIYVPQGDVFYVSVPVIPTLASLRFGQVLNDSTMLVSCWLELCVVVLRP